MVNPWKEISLSDYENHMSLDSIRQLQSLNLTMKEQLDDYDVKTVMIIGIAGGNGLEHVKTNKYCKVLGVDINEDYLTVVKARYKDLAGVLVCLKFEVVEEKYGKYRGKMVDEFIWTGVHRLLQKSKSLHSLVFKEIIKRGKQHVKNCIIYCVYWTYFMWDLRLPIRILT